MKISVITAVYNSEATVGEAIASVAAQEYSDVEHLIIEGKSRDGSLAAIEAAAHDRMVLVSEPDTGIYDALNKGIVRATGDVVGFLHSDDFSGPHTCTLAHRRGVRGP
ncbi:glycosyltransferase [Jhaorihella thermophila]